MSHPQEPVETPAEFCLSEQDGPLDAETMVSEPSDAEKLAAMTVQRDELLIASRFVYGCLQQERGWRNADLNQAMIALSDAIAKAEER